MYVDETFEIYKNKKREGILKWINM
jgi:hypothetical protein